MRRREFFAGLCSIITLPPVAWADQSRRVPVVGVLWHGSREKEWSNPFYHYLHDDFSASGYIDGKTVRFEERYASERQEAYDQLAQELVALRCDVLIGVTPPAALALKRATSQIPILFLGVADPVGSGLVSSVARPGGNVTGMASPPPEMYFKRVKLLKEVAPHVNRLALVADLNVPAIVELERRVYAEAAATNGMQLKVFAAHDKPTIDEAFSNIVQAGYEGVVVTNQGLFFLLRNEISQAALSHRLPSMGPTGDFVSSGLLMSYSNNLRSRFSDLVGYAVRVLKGTQPSELPVQFPTRFELTLNLRTAAALNLVIPPTVHAMADRVVE